MSLITVFSLYTCFPICDDLVRERHLELILMAALTLRGVGEEPGRRASYIMLCTIFECSSLNCIILCNVLFSNADIVLDAKLAYLQAFTTAAETIKSLEYTSSWSVSHFICIFFYYYLLDDRSVRDSERRAAIMHFTSDQVVLLTDTPRTLWSLPLHCRDHGTSLALVCDLYSQQSFILKHIILISISSVQLL